MLFVFRAEDHRHSVVNRPHKFIRFCSNDGEAFHFAVFWLAPRIPKPSQSERFPVPEMHPHRALALSFLPPLAKTVSRNDAPAASDQVLKSGFLGKCFRTGVNHPVSYGGVFGPSRDQPPVHEPALVAALMSDNNRNGGGNLQGLC